MKSMSRSARRAAMVIAALAGSAAAHPDDPFFWTWGMHGSVVHGPRFVELVIVPTVDGLGALMTGAEVAGEVAAEVDCRNLTAGNVGIVLAGFGLGNNTDGGDHALHTDAVTLFYHPDDGLDGSYPYSAHSTEKTPWMLNGKAVARAWMQDFIAEYKSLQGVDVPAPSRFHFDTETTLAPFDTNTASLFDWMVNQESRYDATTGEALLGFPAGTQLEDLYVAAGSPAYKDVSGPLSPPQAPEWYRWYAGVCNQVQEGAMDYAVYQLVQDDEDGWEGCKASDYDMSLRIDGSDGRVYRGRCDADASWLYTAWTGAAALQAPVLYGVTDDHYGGDAPADAAVKRARRILDACIRSNGGVDPQTITPWVAVPDDFDECYEDFDFGDEGRRRLLALIRAKGITEIIAFAGNAGTQAAWNSFIQAKNWVWGSDFASTPYTVQLGTELGTSEMDLANSNATPVIIASEGVGLDHRVRLEVEFESDFNDTCTTTGLEINIESWLTTCSQCSSLASPIASVEIYDYTNSVWDPIGSSFTPGSSGSDPLITRITDSAATDHVSPTGDIKLRITCVYADPNPQDQIEANFIAAFDLVQVVKTAETCP